MTGERRRRGVRLRQHRQSQDAQGIETRSQLGFENVVARQKFVTRAYGTALATTQYLDYADPGKLKRTWGGRSGMQARTKPAGTLVHEAMTVAACG